MSEIPFGEEFWEEVASDERAAEEDPEGFEEVGRQIDEINAERAERGEGEI